MRQPVAGWEQGTPAPNHIFNDYLSARDGRLYFEDLDLTQLFLGDQRDQGLGRTLPSPLEIIYLPKLRQKIARLNQIFAEAIAQVGYAGRFHYAYASKANAAEEVVRTVLGMGVNYEFSSAIDVDIARVMMKAGHLTPAQTVICNGFKPAGTVYASKIVRFQREHGNVIPVVEDLAELPPLIEADIPFEVGIRQKCYGEQRDITGMEAIDSRFGMNLDDIRRAAESIASAPHLHLKLYHAMVGGQMVDKDNFIARLRTPIEIYAQLRQKHPDLRIFDFGGGMPAPMTLDFDFDYHAFARQLLTTLQNICNQHGVPVPDVMGEIGRYTVTEHGAHLFKILLSKSNGSQLPWYVIDGSIMSSFPDTWALGEHFIVLPLNHLDKPFRQVRLGGLTCDSDDVYPPESSPAKLYLPVETNDLYVGFFGIGAYQEMLGGAGGSKHCVIPEANELIIDRDEDGNYVLQLLPGQDPENVLKNLGYGEFRTARLARTGSSNYLGHRFAHSMRESRQVQRIS
ncbi:MAG: arginine decarboxylase [Anaerolineales bacterium]